MTPRGQGPNESDMEFVARLWGRPSRELSLERLRHVRFALLRRYYPEKGGGDSRLFEQIGDACDRIQRRGAIQVTLEDLKKMQEKSDALKGKIKKLESLLGRAADMLDHLKPVGVFNAEELDKFEDSAEDEIESLIGDIAAVLNRKGERQ